MKSQRSSRRGPLQMLGLTLLLFSAVAISIFIPLIRDWQSRFTDTFFRLSPSPKQKSDVVLITIDDESLQQYGRWPWSRTLLAKLTHNLTNAGASVVGLDILLSEPQSPDADRALQNALLSRRRLTLIASAASFLPASSLSRVRAGLSPLKLLVG